MAPSLAVQTESRHPVLPDISRPRLAKPDVQILDADEWLVRIGRAIERAIAVVGWTHKQAADRIGVDAAEFGKWLSGGRRPQFDKCFAVPELREPLVLELAALTDGLRVKTTIEWERRVSA